MTFKGFFLVSAIATFAASSSSAATFTDLDAFNAATVNVTTETFDENITQNGVTSVPITFANGTTSTANGPGTQFNRVENGVFRGGTRNGRNAADNRTIVFDFGRDVTAFGADFQFTSATVNNNAADIVLSGIFDGVLSSILLGDLRSDTGFIGLTSSTAFSTVTFSTDAGGVSPFGNVAFTPRNFRLDNLALGDAAGEPISPVPLPASAFMLLAALGGFGAVSKMRRRA